MAIENTCLCLYIQLEKNIFKNVPDDKLKSILEKSHKIGDVGFEPLMVVNAFN